MDRTDRVFALIDRALDLTYRAVGTVLVVACLLNAALCAFLALTMPFETALQPRDRAIVMAACLLCSGLMLIGARVAMPLREGPSSQTA